MQVGFVPSSFMQVGHSVEAVGSYNLCMEGWVVHISKKFSDSHETFSVCQFMFDALLMVRTDNVMHKMVYQSLKPCTCMYRRYVQGENPENQFRAITFDRSVP